MGSHVATILVQPPPVQRMAPDPQPFNPLPGVPAQAQPVGDMCLFVCPHCEKPLSSRGTPAQGCRLRPTVPLTGCAGHAASLKNHIVLVHGAGNRFDCPECSAPFTSSSACRGGWAARIRSLARPPGCSGAGPARGSRAQGLHPVPLLHLRPRLRAATCVRPRRLWGWCGSGDDRPCMARAGDLNRHMRTDHREQAAARACDGGGDVDARAHAAPAPARTHARRGHPPLRL